MNLKFSSSTSFDNEVATIYGVHEAILINHFAHWIRINQRANRNKHDGRTWMYQTLEEIAENFPYLTKEQVRTIIDRLCEGKNRQSKGKKEFEPVLIKGNYNKLAIDKTNWYAFVDESFLNSNNSYERVNTQIDVGKYPVEMGKYPDVIPEANNTEAINPFFQKGAINRDESQESPLSDRKKKIASLLRFSQDYGFNISERDLGIWLAKYDFDRIKRNIALAKRRKYKDLIKFLQTALKNDYAQEEENVKTNKKFLQDFCSQNKIKAKITEKYATFEGGYDMQFKLNPDQFNQMLLNYYTKQQG